MHGTMCTHRIFCRACKSRNHSSNTFLSSVDNYPTVVEKTAATRLNYETANKISNELYKVQSTKFLGNIFMLRIQGVHVHALHMHSTTAQITIETFKILTVERQLYTYYNVAGLCSASTLGCQHDTARICY